MEEGESASTPAAVLKSGYIYREGEQIKDAETITRTCGLFFSRGGGGSGGNDSAFTLEGVQWAAADKGSDDQRRCAAAVCGW